MSSPVKRGSRLGGTTTERPQPFGPGGLDAHRRLYHRAQTTGHLRDVIGQSGSLTDDSAVGVHHRHRFPFHQSGDPAQQIERIGPGPLRVGVGEVSTEVSETDRPEKGVGQRVGHHVGVAVSGQPGHAGNDDAPEDEGPSREGREPVNVETLTDPDP